MAKVADGIFKDWQDSEIVTAVDYKKEREILRVATNDNDERIGFIEESVVGFQLDNAQLTKITNNNGGVKISVMSTSENILQKILDAGEGLHTFYAVSGSQGLPHTNISIRGIAHMTSSNIGWMYATDYRNNIFTNYYDTSAWKGWKELVGVNDQAKATNLNNMRTRGSFYVDPGTTNSPQPSIWGMLTVEHFNVDSYGSITQMFIDGTTGESYTRAWTGFVWTKWNRNVTYNDVQDELWGSDAGWYMHATQTVTPIKKLSQCRNGWILLWSDHNPGEGSNNYNWTSTMIPKFMGTKHNGNNWSIGLSAGTSGGQADTIATKELTIYDDRIVGNANNDQGFSTDVVLRYVVEW